MFFFTFLWVFRQFPSILSDLCLLFFSVARFASKNCKSYCWRVPKFRRAKFKAFCFPNQWQWSDYQYFFVLLFCENLFNDTIKYLIITLRTVRIHSFHVTFQFMHELFVAMFILLKLNVRNLGQINKRLQLLCPHLRGHLIPNLPQSHAITYNYLPLQKSLNDWYITKFLLLSISIIYCIIINLDSGKIIFNWTCNSWIVWPTNIDNRLITCGIFLDLRKAFDTVNQTMLLKKPIPLWD